MSKKTLPNQLLAYLQQQGDFVAGAALSRLEWGKYAYGERRGSHSPRAVIRRLQELAEDCVCPKNQPCTSELHVQYKGTIALYATQKKTSYPKTVYWKDKVFEVKSPQEEEKWKALAKV